MCLWSLKGKRSQIFESVADGIHLSSFSTTPQMKNELKHFFTTIPSFEEVFKCSKKCVFIFQSSL